MYNVKGTVLDTHQVSFSISPDYFMSFNDRRHRTVRAKQTKALKYRANKVAAGLSCHFTPENPCKLIVRVTMPTKRRFDPMNAAPSVKALVDGCVQAGALSDDDSTVLKIVGFMSGGNDKNLGKRKRIDLCFLPIRKSTNG